MKDEYTGGAFPAGIGLAAALQQAQARELGRVAAAATRQCGDILEMLEAEAAAAALGGCGGDGGSGSSGGGGGANGVGSASPMKFLKSKLSSGSGAGDNAYNLGNNTSGSGCGRPINPKS